MDPIKNYYPVIARDVTGALNPMMIGLRESSNFDGVFEDQIKDLSEDDKLKLRMEVDEIIDEQQMDDVAKVIILATDHAERLLEKHFGIFVYGQNRVKAEEYLVGAITILRVVITLDYPILSLNKAYVTDFPGDIMRALGIAGHPYWNVVVDFQQDETTIVRRDPDFLPSGIDYAYVRGTHYVK